MKIAAAIIGALISLSGLAYLLAEYGLFLPSFQTAYKLIILAIGLVSLIYGTKNNYLMGAEKFIIVTVSLIVSVLALLSSLNLEIPFAPITSGVIFGVIIIILGLIETIYGFSRL